MSISPSTILADLGIPDADGKLSRLIEHPPKEDFLIRTVYKSPETFFRVVASVVICSEETRRAFPAAKKHPVQFKKTAENNVHAAGPRGEYEHAKILHKKAPGRVPEPIACGEKEYRSEYVPGITLRCLAIRFGLSRPLKTDIPFTPRTPTEGDLAALWHHAEQATESLRQVHQAGYIHGDLHLENIIIAPGRAVLVDLETARKSHGPEDENADFGNLKSFARKLLNAGAQPPKDSVLLKIVNEEDPPLAAHTPPHSNITRRAVALNV